jgi:hypothetical protein
MQHTDSKEESVIGIKDLLLTDRCCCPYESVIVFRLTGSKHSQYLRKQPSKYVGFPYAGWWREKERQRETEREGEREREREGWKGESTL